MRVSGGAVLLVVLVLSLAGGACSAPPPAGPPDTIVLISIDTLRADHLGAYGYSRPTSPFLDRVASRGVLFEQAISPAPWTLPAHASLMTGLSTSGHGAVDAGSGMSPSVTTLAEALREGGFATAGVVTSWFVSRGYGFDRGFDWFEDFSAARGETRRRKVRATRVVDEASRWLAQRPGERVFLFLHLYDAHYDYAAPAPYGEMFDTGYEGPRPRYRHYRYYRRHPLSEDHLAQEIAQYDGEIRYVDAEIERLWGILEGLDRSSSTLLVVTSDHGEEFFERGSWGHAHTLHRELMRVPLLVAGPGVARGRRVTDQVRLVDLLPTLLDAAGLEWPDDVEGRSLWPILTHSEVEAPAEVSRPALLESYRFDTRLIGLQRSGWKLITDLRSQEEQLYSLASDPDETRDVAVANPDTLAALREELKVALLAAMPNRWSIAWSSDSPHEVVGELTTEGRFLEAKIRGDGGEAHIDAEGSRVRFEITPGAALEVAVVPVDASITLDDVRRRDGSPVALVIGELQPTIPGRPVTVSPVGRRWDRKPEVKAETVLVWLEQKRQSPNAVELDEETRDQLRALGYTM